MKVVKLISDYSPDTFMKIFKNDDCDIIMKIYGKDEMRIATSGSRFYGEQKIRLLNAFSEIINVLEEIDKEQMK